MGGLRAGSAQATGTTASGRGHGGLADSAGTGDRRGAVARCE